MWLVATITGQNSYQRWKQIHWVQQELFNRGQAASSNLKLRPDAYLRIGTLPSKPNKGQRSLVQGQTPTITSYAGSPTQLLPKPVCLQTQLWTRWKGKLTINNLYCFSHWDRFFTLTFTLTIIMTCSHHYAYWITGEIGKSMAPAQFQKAGSSHTVILLLQGKPSQGLWQSLDTQTSTEVVDHRHSMFPTAGHLCLECWKLTGVLTKHEVTTDSLDSKDKLHLSIFLRDLNSDEGLPLRWRAAKPRA